MSGQLISSYIAGINSVLTISFSYVSWLLLLGLVCIKYVGLRLIPVIKHEYTACASYYSILHNISQSIMY